MATHIDNKNKIIFIVGAIAISAMLLFVVFISVKFLKNETSRASESEANKNANAVRFEFEKVEKLGIIND